MKYAVMGLGRCGKAIVYDLLRFGQAESIVVYDKDSEAILTTQHVPLSTDAGKIRKTHTEGEFWKRIDQTYVLVSALPARFNLDVTSHARRCNIDMCDLGGVSHIVQEQKFIGGSSGSLIVPGCGLAPGMCDIIAQDFAKRGCTSIKVRCGGIPLLPPDNLFRHKLGWNTAGLVSEYGGTCPVLRDGTIFHAAALSGKEESGDYESFYTSNLSEATFWQLQNLGVRDYDYKTIRYKGHLNCLLGWDQLGYFKQQNLINRLIKTLNENKNLWYSQGEKDKVLLEITGKFDPISRVERSCNYSVQFDAYNSFQAMELATSWGIGIIAYWIARNKRASNTSSLGFVLPADLVDSGWFLDELDMRQKAFENDIPFSKKRP